MTFLAAPRISSRAGCQFAAPWAVKIPIVFSRRSLGRVRLGETSLSGDAPKPATETRRGIWPSCLYFISKIDMKVKSRHQTNLQEKFHCGWRPYTSMTGTVSGVNRGSAEVCWFRDAA